MDEQRLKEIEARAAAATHGRLLVSDNEEGWRVDVDSETDPHLHLDGSEFPDGALLYAWRREDLELFVEARQDIPDLLKALRAAQARVARLEAVGRAAITFYRAAFPDEDERPNGVAPIPLSVVVAALDLKDAIDKAKEHDQGPVPDTDEVDLPC